MSEGVAALLAAMQQNLTAREVAEAQVTALLTVANSVQARDRESYTREQVVYLLTEVALGISAGSAK